MSHARSPRPLTAQALRCCFHLRQRSNLRGLLSLLQLRNPFTLIRRVAALSKNGLLLTNPRVVFVSGAHLNTAPYLGHGKCFYEETYISPTPVGINMWVYLSDLLENRIYGGFHRSTNIGFFYCNLQNKECHSETEWEALVKSYIE